MQFVKDGLSASAFPYRLAHLPNRIASSFAATFPAFLEVSAKSGQNPID